MGWGSFGSEGPKTLPKTDLGVRKVYPVLQEVAVPCLKVPATAANIWTLKYPPQISLRDTLGPPEPNDLYPSGYYHTPFLPKM